MSIANIQQDRYCAPFQHVVWSCQGGPIDFRRQYIQSRIQPSERHGTETNNGCDFPLEEISQFTQIHRHIYQQRGKQSDQKSIIAESASQTSKLHTGYIVDQEDHTPNAGESQ